MIEKSFLLWLDRSATTASEHLLSSQSATMLLKKIWNTWQNPKISSNHSCIKVSKIFCQFFFFLGGCPGPKMLVTADFLKLEMCSLTPSVENGTLPRKLKIKYYGIYFLMDKNKNLFVSEFTQCRELQPDFFLPTFCLDLVWTCTLIPVNTTSLLWIAYYWLFMRDCCMLT